MKNQIKKTLAVAAAAALSLGVLTACQPAESVADALGAGEEYSESTETVETETTETAETANTESSESETGYVASGSEMTINDINVADYISLGDYKNLNVEIPEVEVSDEEVEALYKEIYSYYAGLVDTADLITDRAVEEGDIISLDYAGYKDGVAFDGGTAENQTLWIGSNTFIDGFEAGLVGVNPGETVDLNLTFPENYGNEELAGAAVVFTCTVHGIVPEEKIFELFLETEVGEGESEYTADAMGMNRFAYDYLLSYKSDSVDTEDLILTALRDIVTVENEFPTDLILAYQDMYANNLNYYASMYGYEAEDFAQAAFGTSAESYISDNSYDALVTDAMLQYIADNEGLNLTDDQVADRLNTMATDYGYGSAEEMLGESIDYNTYRVYFMEEDVFSWLAENLGE